MTSAGRRVVNSSGFRYTIEKVVGEGAFGTVYLIYCLETGERVALKKVLEDKRYKSRELEILQVLHHPNCLTLIHSFVSESQSTKKLYLNLVTEYVPETLSGIERQYLSIGQTIPTFLIKLISYQLLRSLAYLHAKKICHRDIKPANILLHSSNCHLKLCDFGSAKFIRPNEPSISYITSRNYRAPELILGNTRYDGAIDLWSAGCVIAEMLLGQPLFSGESNAEQFLAIIHILGSPSHGQLIAMNPQCSQFDLPNLPPLPWKQAFRASTDPNGVDLVSKLCVYQPQSRLSGYQALLHPFFSELMDPNVSLPNGKEMPPLFDFTPEEIGFIGPELLKQLVPLHLQNGRPPIEKISSFGNFLKVEEDLGGEEELCEEDIVEEE
jgi:serine/threonine protein kinase